MNLDLTADQKELLDAAVRISLPFRSVPTGSHSYFLDGTSLYDALEEAGFLSAATMPEYGALSGALLAELGASLPYSAGLAGAALVAPMTLGMTLPGPVALTRAGDARAIRHLPVAKTLLVECQDGIRSLDMENAEVRVPPTIFSDPVGSVAPSTWSDLPVLDGVPVGLFRQWWSVAVAAEICGAASAAVDMTVEFVKMRRQFGKPIGTYQAIQHRLSECEVLVHGARMLTYRAAVTQEPAHAFLAATYAQAAAGRVAYDTQQFHGASGLTRENDLHFFTYRLRALQGELGVPQAPHLEAARHLWPRSESAVSSKGPAQVAA